MRGLLRTVLCMVVAFVMLSGTAMAQSTTLGWDPPTTNTDGSPLTDLAGFKVFYGESSRAYIDSIDVGNVLTAQWELGNQSGKTLYFTVTAYNTSGVESPYGPEIFMTFPTLAPSPPTNLQGVVD